MNTGFSLYIETGSSIACLAGCTPEYLRLKAIEGLVPHIKAANGMRLYPREAADVVRKLKAEGLARRGDALKRKATMA